MKATTNATNRQTGETKMVTDPTHYGLTLLAKTHDTVILAGTLANCRRVAFAHGLEIERYEGATVAIDRDHAVYAPADATNFVWCHFRQGGFILRDQDDYTLLIRREIWDNF